MRTRRFESYVEAEKEVIKEIVTNPDFITKSTYEVLGLGFVLENPVNNKNHRSNYEYANAFFQWLLEGEAELNEEMLTLNPWVARFVTTSGLPENFSASYPPKIKRQTEDVLSELAFKEESRRAFMHVLYPEDAIIRERQTTHEYPCTIGLHLFIREKRLHMIVNMRSNNCWSVMPYDVFNFTNLQIHFADMLGVGLGDYHHQMNSAHIYKGDVRRIKETF